MYYLNPLLDLYIWYNAILVQQLPIFHHIANPFTLGLRVGYSHQCDQFALPIPTCWYVGIVKLVDPKQTPMDPTQTNMHPMQTPMHPMHTFVNPMPTLVNQTRAPTTMLRVDHFDHYAACCVTLTVLTRFL